MNFRRYDVIYIPKQHGGLLTEISDRWRQTVSRFPRYMSRDVAIAYINDLRRQTKGNPK